MSATQNFQNVSRKYIFLIELLLFFFENLKNIPGLVFSSPPPPNGQAHSEVFSGLKMRFKKKKSGFDCLDYLVLFTIQVKRKKRANGERLCFVLTNRNLMGS